MSTDTSPKLQSHSRQVPETMAERVEFVLRLETAHQKQWILRHRLKYLRAFTHAFVSNCVVGYPPQRIFELNHDVMPRCGSQIVCAPPPNGQKNKLEVLADLHCWELVMLQGQRIAA